MGEVNGIRADLVARFKKEIQENRYKVKSEELADKIAQKLKEDETFVGTIKQKGWRA